MFDSKKIKSDFPILNRQINGKPLVYLDNAATSQKPQVVIDAITDYYSNHNANIHRGVHTLGDESTMLWHESRQTIAKFFGTNEDQLILTNNTTEAINLVAYGWGDHNLERDDVVLVSLMDHHSSIVVWQQLCARTGAKLELIPVTENGELDMDWLSERLALSRSENRVRLVAVPHVSNTLGTLNPVKEIAKKTRKINAKILVDGAQSAPHMHINFDSLEADFYTFSAHKMLGPMGVGGLLVKSELLSSVQFPTGVDTPLPKGDDKLYPMFFGGGMIDEVSALHTRFHEDVSDRFTAGTPNVAGAIGLAAACNYLNKLDMNLVFDHDQELVDYTLSKLATIEKVKIVGPMNNRVGSVAFIYDGVHAHDVAQILDSEGMAVRSGHHCTMPLHQHFNWVATTRISFQVYNQKSDIDELVKALKKVEKVAG